MQFAQFASGSAGGDHAKRFPQIVAIFPAASDSEVVLQLMAHPSERTLAGALHYALLQLQGAFSLLFMAEDRITVARDPHGFRPLAVLVVTRVFSTAIRRGLRPAVARGAPARPPVLL